MSDLEMKNSKKPISFRKPTQKNDHSKKVPGEILRAKKVNFMSQIRGLEDEIKLLTSYSSDTIYRLDYRTMKYNYISPAVTRLLGFTPQEMKRIQFRSLIAETRLVTDGLHRISSFEELENKRKTGDVGKWNADYLIRTKSGQKIWVSDISYPWFDENGKVIGSVGSLRDITERVKVEQKLFSDIQSISTQDSLTQLPGKANFFAALSKELIRIKRSKQQVALVIFEIQSIENVVAKFGQDLANELIIAASQIIRSALRESDLISRIEGGTFAVMLPETEVKGAYYVADRVRESIMRTQFAFGGDRSTLDVSIAAGISVADQTDNLSAADMYKLADTRLFIARNTGANMVSLDEINAVH